MPWRDDQPWRRLTETLRDLLPWQWECPPLARGQQIAAIDSPNRKVGLRIWEGGNRFGPPAPFLCQGRLEQPSPLTLACYQRSAQNDGMILVFTIDSPIAAAPVEYRRLDRDPDLVVRAVIKAARKWEADNRPDLPWVSRKQDVENRQKRSREAFEMAVARVSEVNAQRAAQESDAQKRRQAWSVRRGHATNVEKAGHSL